MGIVASATAGPWLHWRHVILARDVGGADSVGSGRLRINRLIPNVFHRDIHRLIHGFIHRQYGRLQSSAKRGSVLRCSVSRETLRSGHIGPRATGELERGTR